MEIGLMVGTTVLVTVVVIAGICLMLDRGAAEQDRPQDQGNR